MSQIARVQTYYSFKQSDGSLIPRGIYSVDAPGGIPDVVLAEAISGKTTVRVLEWRDAPVKKKDVVEEPVAEKEVTEEDTSEEKESEEVAEEEEKVTEKPKMRRKRK